MKTIEQIKKLEKNNKTLVEQIKQKQINIKKKKIKSVVKLRQNVKNVQILRTQRNLHLFNEYSKDKDPFEKQAQEIENFQNAERKYLNETSVKLAKQLVDKEVENRRLIKMIKDLEKQDKMIEENLKLNLNQNQKKIKNKSQLKIKKKEQLNLTNKKEFSKKSDKKKVTKTKKDKSQNQLKKTIKKKTPLKPKKVKVKTTQKKVKIQKKTQDQKAEKKQNSNREKAKSVVFKKNIQKNPKINVNTSKKMDTPYIETLNIQRKDTASKLQKPVFVPSKQSQQQNNSQQSVQEVQKQQNQDEERKQNEKDEKNRQNDQNEQDKIFKQKNIEQNDKDENYSQMSGTSQQNSEGESSDQDVQSYDSKQEQQKHLQDDDENQDIRFDVEKVQNLTQSEIDKKFNEYEKNIYDQPISSVAYSKISKQTKFQNKKSIKDFMKQKDYDEQKENSKRLEAIDEVNFRSSQKGMGSVRNSNSMQVFQSFKEKLMEDEIDEVIDEKSHKQQKKSQKNYNKNYSLPHTVTQQKEPQDYSQNKKPNKVHDQYIIEDIVDYYIDYINEETIDEVYLTNRKKKKISITVNKKSLDDQIFDQAPQRSTLNSKRRMSNLSVRKSLNMDNDTIDAAIIQHMTPAKLTEKQIEDISNEIGELRNSKDVNSKDIQKMVRKKSRASMNMEDNNIVRNSYQFMRKKNTKQSQNMMKRAKSAQSPFNVNGSFENAGFFFKNAQNNSGDLKYIQTFANHDEYSKQQQEEYNNQPIDNSNPFLPENFSNYQRQKQKKNVFNFESDINNKEQNDRVSSYVENIESRKDIFTELPDDDLLDDQPDHENSYQFSFVSKKKQYRKVQTEDISKQQSSQIDIQDSQGNMNYNVEVENYFDFDRVSKKSSDAEINLL